MDQQPMRKKHLLIVEDDPDISYIYSKEFEGHGFLVDTAFTGEEGIEKAKSLLPDAILLDIMLPKMSGFDVLNAIKAEETTKSIPVIILSNLSDDSSIKKGFAEKADGYILKSSEVPDQVIEDVQNILNQHA